MVVVPSGPQVGAGAPQGQQFTATRVTPSQNVTGRQLQQLGAASSRAGNELLRLGIQKQQKINNSRIREMDALTADDDRTEWLEYRKQLGKAGVDGFQGVMDRFDQRSKEIAEKLDNDEQKAKFAEQRLRRREDFSNRVEGHYSNQVEVQEQASTESRALGLADDAVIGFFDGTQDPQGKKHRGRITGALGEARRLARMRGQDPDEAAQKLATKIHSDVVNQLLADAISDPTKLDDAEAYLKANRGVKEMDPGQATILDMRVSKALVARDKDRIKQAEDGAAFDLAARLNADRSLSPQQREQEVLRLRGEGLPVGVAQDAIAQVRSYADNLSEDEGREIRDIKRLAEQKAAESKETIQYGDLDRQTRIRIEELGIRNDVEKSLSNVRLRKLEESQEELDRFDAFYRTTDGQRRFQESLDKRIAKLDGLLATTEDPNEQVELQGKIDRLTKQSEQHQLMVERNFDRQIEFLFGDITPAVDVPSTGSFIDEILEGLLKGGRADPTPQQIQQAKKTNFTNRLQKLSRRMGGKK